jgi:hypothetical protein
VRTVASAEHGAHRSTDKRSWRSTDTRSMSSLQLYNTRTRAHQAFVPRIRQAGSGCSSAGRRLRPPAPRPRQRLHPVGLPRPPAADPRRRRHVRAEHHRRGRQDHPPGARRVRARAHVRARDLDGMRAPRNDSVDVYARASDTSTTSSARSGAGSRRARCHQGAQLDAQLVEIIHRMGGSTRTSLPRPRRRAPRHGPGTRAAVAPAGCARSEGRQGDSSLGAPGLQRGTRRRSAHICDASG